MLLPVKTYKALIFISALHILTLPFGFASSPYAPSSLSNQDARSKVTFVYNSAGGRLTGKSDDRDYTISYGLIGKPVAIASSDGNEVFNYATDGSRYFRVNAVGVKTLYVGEMEYRIEGAEAKSVHYIYNNTFSPIVQVESTAGNLHYTYYVSDHQGTPMQEVDQDSGVVKHNHYDPWGLPVNASGTALSKMDIDEKSRSFTGYETIKSFSLYHAKGRVYDPLVGFVSPDPILLSANLVSHNRYAYTLNSPPNYVDVSGYAPYSMKAMKRANSLGMELEDYYFHIDKDENISTLTEIDIKIREIRRKRLGFHIRQEYPLKRELLDKEKAYKLAIKAAKNRIKEEDDLAKEVLTPIPPLVAANVPAATGVAGSPASYSSNRTFTGSELRELGDVEELAHPLSAATAFEVPPVVHAAVIPSPTSPALSASERTIGSFSVDSDFKLSPGTPHEPHPASHLQDPPTTITRPAKKPKGILKRPPKPPPGIP